MYLIIGFIQKYIHDSRRRLCQQKKKENAWYKGGNHQIDDKDHEYSGIEYQSNDREDHNPNVLEPHVSVSDGHYTETQFDSDDKDHQYTELNEIKMNQLTEATADRSVQLQNVSAIKILQNAFFKMFIFLIQTQYFRVILICDYICMICIMI